MARIGRGQRLSGQRRDLSLDPTTTCKDVPKQWRKGDLRPGDMLYLPTGWWHAVLSDMHAHGDDECVDKPKKIEERKGLGKRGN